MEIEKLLGTTILPSQILKLGNILGKRKSTGSHQFAKSNFQKFENIVGEENPGYHHFAKSNFEKLENIVGKGDMTGY